jgi:hypothetical protein
MRIVFYVHESPLLVPNRRASEFYTAIPSVNNHKKSVCRYIIIIISQWAFIVCISMYSNVSVRIVCMCVYYTYLCALYVFFVSVSVVVTFWPVPPAGELEVLTTTVTCIN